MKKRKKSRKALFRYRKALIFFVSGLVVLALLWPYIRSFFLKTLIPIGRAEFGVLEAGAKGEAILLRKEVVLRAPCSGVIKFYAKDGDVLRVGDVIAEISQEGILEGARENLELAAKALRQYENEKASLFSRLSSEIDSEYSAFVFIVDDLRASYLRKDAKGLLGHETRLDTVANQLGKKREELGFLLDERARLVRDVELAQMVLASSSVKILSPMAGVFSQKVLEMDEKITPDSLSKKNAAELTVLMSELKNQKTIGPRKGAKVSSGDVLGKVVSQVNAKFFMPLKTEERPMVTEGKEVSLKFDDAEILEARIESVNDGNPKGYSVITGNLAYLPYDKKENVTHISIVTKSHYGAILDRRSLIFKDDQPGVLTVEKTYASFRPVEILMTEGSRVVVKGVRETDEIVLKPFRFLEGRRVR